MTEEGWNHNTHYHERLLEALPHPCGRVLDVGCGRGAFARRLAGMAAHVDAIDRDSASITFARLDGLCPTNVTFTHHDFLSWESGEPYNAITMVATLHHLPFEAALSKAVSLLRPDGVLIVLGLHRTPSLLHLLAQAVVAVPFSRFNRLTRGFRDVGAPIREPDMTLAEIRRRSAVLLPGIVIRQHLLWRYSFAWTRTPRS